MALTTTERASLLASAQALVASIEAIPVSDLDPVALQQQLDSANQTIQSQAENITALQSNIAGLESLVSTLRTRITNAVATLQPTE